jgi:acetyltransferase-like isoleucine patch superfamily enzyme
MAGDVVRAAWSRVTRYGAIASESRRARRFRAFGPGSVIMFPPAALYNEQYIAIGAGTLIGAHVSLSAGMAPGQKMLSDTVVRIGDRCLIGWGSSVVGHFDVQIGDDVFTGHNVYITDQNHGYDDLSLPIGKQSQAERAVAVGSGSWLGHGVVVLPGARIGRHVAVGANSVVTGELPDYCVAAGVPARVIRSYGQPTA